MRISPGSVSVNEEPESVGREMEGAMIKAGRAAIPSDTQTPVVPINEDPQAGVSASSAPNRRSRRTVSVRKVFDV